MDANPKHNFRSNNFTDILRPLWSTGEMALLVEGLGVGGDTSVEEYIIGPPNDLADNQEHVIEKDQIKLYGPEQGQSWVARPVTGQSTLGLVSRQGSLANQNVPLMDPLVALFGSVHEKFNETGSMRSMLFPTMGSMFSVAEHHGKNEQWDEESLHRDGEEYASDGGGESDDNLHSPLLSRQATSAEKDMVPPAANSSVLNIRRHSSLMQGTVGEAGTSMGIGGGWQLAWKWSEKRGIDGKKEKELQRIYLRPEDVPGSQRGSVASLPPADAHEECSFVQAAALVSHSMLFSKGKDKHPIGPAAVPTPAESAAVGPSWHELFEPGVKRALFVGVGIQILQQVSLFWPEVPFF